jgi:hypothetical protein
MLTVWLLGWKLIFREERTQQGMKNPIQLHGRWIEVQGRGGPSQKKGIDKLKISSLMAEKTD